MPKSATPIGQATVDEQVKEGINADDTPGCLGMDPINNDCCAAELAGICKVKAEMMKRAAEKIIHILESLLCKVLAGIYFSIEKSS